MRTASRCALPDTAVCSASTTGPRATTEYSNFCCDICAAAAAADSAAASKIAGSESGSGRVEDRRQRKRGGAEGGEWGQKGAATNRSAARQREQSAPRRRAAPLSQARAFGMEGARPRARQSTAPRRQAADASTNVDAARANRTQAAAVAQLKCGLPVPHSRRGHTRGPWALSETWPVRIG
eukprot:361603-Chlamydomonas_euryale.AAC.14